MLKDFCRGLRVRIYTTPKKFENSVFTQKTDHMFSVHTRLDGFEKANMTGQIGIVFEENSFSSPEAALLLVRIATSGQVQHRKSAIHGLSVTLSMLRVKSDSTNLISSGLYLLCLQSHSIQNRNVVGPGQRSRFLVLTSGDDTKEVT